MFSVVIPVYNHARFVSEAIFSALRDRLVDEVLIADDGSRDASPEVIDTFRGLPRVRVVDSSGENIGAHARLNQLCRLASSSWIAPLNSDDVFVPGRFAAVRSVLRETGAEVVSGALEIIDRDGRLIGRKRGMLDPEYAIDRSDCPRNDNKCSTLFDLLTQNFVATTTNMIFSKDLFDHVGGFREYRYIHDWDFILRAALEGRMAFTQAYLAQYRIHGANTIGESSRNTEAEVLRMFVDLERTYPRALSRPWARAALRQNRYLEPNLRARIDIAAPRPPAPAAAVTQPSPPPPGQAARMRLAAALRRELTGERRVAVTGRCVTSGGPTDTLAILSTPGRDLETVSLDAEPSFQSAFDRYGGVARTKPVILVLSGFFAVGGVERNTVEVMRGLSDRFDFFVLTFEKHWEAVGSLHYELDELGVRCVDLAHVAGPTDFLASLEIVVRALRPHLVYIVNGATWLALNAAVVRGLLRHVPIVDQQVYDTEEGWIREFVRPGILASDHFIAINSKIRDVFVDRFRIPGHSISLIYHAISSDRVRRVAAKRPSRREILAGFGIEDDGRLNIAFIGRITAQKRPDRFLDLAQAHATDPRLRFLLIGRGPLEAEIEAAIAGRGLSNLSRIRQYGDVSDIGAIADGLVICSDYEGLPIVLLEHMAMGVPYFAAAVGDIDVVAARFGGGAVLPEWTTEGAVSGFSDWLAMRPRYAAELREAHDAIMETFADYAVCARYRRVFEDQLARAVVDAAAPATPGDDDGARLLESVAT